MKHNKRSGEASRLKSLAQNRASGAKQTARSIPKGSDGGRDCKLKPTPLSMPKSVKGQG